MNVAEQDYRIWKNDNFVVESSITVPLWNKELINDFHNDLSKVLYNIYEKSNLNSSNSKNFISLCFSGDEKIIELNNSFKKINTATNVLSFPSQLKSNNKLFLGDIIFSIQTISREAKRDNKSIHNHLIHLFIHGVLHLLGYEHDTDEQAERMENLEISILKTLNINNPYD